MIMQTRPRESARDIFRRRVTEAASSRSMAQATNRIGEAFNRARRMPEARREIEVERIERLLESNWKLGRISVLDHIDCEQLISDSFRGHWGDMRRVVLAESEQYRTPKIQEHLMDVMTSTQFANLLTTIIRFGVVERCELAPMELLSLVATNLRLSTGTTKVPKFRTTADVVDDCEAELKETQFYSIPSPNLITLPKACKKKFAMGYTREMLGVDPNGALRAEIDRHGEAMDLHIEKLLVDVMFGLYDTGTAGANPFPYIEDDIEWHTYQTVGGGGPWENDITSNALDGTYLPFETLERIMEGQRDPYSGEPVVCGGMSKVLVTNMAARQLVFDALGTHTITRDFAFGTNGRVETVRPAGRWDLQPTDVYMSRYIHDRLTAWYQTTAGGGLNLANATAAARNTWLYGDFSRAFALGTEWDRERITRGGTETYEYFTQEIIFSVKWMEKTTPAVLDPMVCYRNRT